MSKSAAKSSRPRLLLRVVAALLAAAIISLLILSQKTPQDPISPQPIAAATTASPAPDTPPPSATPPPPPSAPPDPTLTALLEGLRLGQDVAGWKVTAFHAPKPDQSFWSVEFQKGDLLFGVGIGLKGTGKPPPPIQTELYEVGFGFQKFSDPQQPDAGIVPVPGHEIFAVAEAIAQRIRRRESATPRPAGL